VRKVHGHFDRFIGQVVTAEDPLRSSATATVDLDSVNTGDEARDKDLRSGNFLDAADFPAMTYRTTGVRREGKGYVVDGELTVHGVTQPVSLRFRSTPRPCCVPGPRRPRQRNGRHPGHPGAVARGRTRMSPGVPRAEGRAAGGEGR
jgi:YceI-like domain